MTQYAEVAVEAVRLYTSSHGLSPRVAWDQAATRLIRSKESQKKSCPRDAFLGLCEEGLIVGIPRDEYTDSELNKGYAVKAVQLLRSNADLSDNPRALWDLVQDGEDKAPNGQMDVVTALWNKGLITA